MTSDAQLQALGRVAQLKSDLELKKFSAFRSHVVALEGRIAAIRDELSTLSAGDAPGTLDDLRAAAAVAGRNAEALLRAEAELARMRPGFEAARLRAVREFGRTQVLSRIRTEAAEDRRARREGKP